MSCEIGALIENVERKCLPSEVCRNLSPHVGVRHYAICVYAIYACLILSYMLLVIFMYNHMAH